MSIDMQEMAERHGRALAEIAQMALEAARDLHACALAAEDPQAKTRLNAAFNRTCRSLRQSMALEARLAREAARTEADRQAAHAAERKRRAEQHRDRVATQVVALVWNEYDDADEAVEVEADIRFQLSQEARADDFLDTPVEAHVARLAEEFGLSLPKASTPEPAAEPPAPAPRPLVADHPWRPSG